MKEQNKGSQNEGRGGEPVAPAQQPLQQPGTEGDDAAFGIEIAHRDEQGQQKKEDAAHLPANGLGSILGYGGGLLGILGLGSGLGFGGSAFCCGRFLLCHGRSFPIRRSMSGSRTTRPQPSSNRRNRRTCPFGRPAGEVRRPEAQPEGPPPCRPGRPAGRSSRSGS